MSRSSRLKVEHIQGEYIYFSYWGLHIGAHLEWIFLGWKNNENFFLQVGDTTKTVSSKTINIIFKKVKNQILNETPESFCNEVLFKRI